MTSNGTTETDESIFVLPADKGRVTVVVDKTDYYMYDKMDTLVNDKQTQVLNPRPDASTST